MPREAVATKYKLIRAGEHVFAREGIDGALTREIVTRAGQANDSAIHYHFGSRSGLLAAIIDEHVQGMEADRRVAADRLGAQPRLPALVAAIIEPVANKLRNESGRDFVRIIAQLAGQAQAGVTETAPLRGTALADQLETLHVMCRDRLPRRVAAERIGLMITMLTAALAERARQIESGRRVSMGHDAYVANLVAMLTAALRAPVA